MQLQGKVSVVLGESRLGGKLLAIQGEPDPFGAATNFLANRNIFNKTTATINGDDGFVGTVPAFFITSAVAGFSPLAFNLTESAAKPSKKAAAKKSASKSPKKSAGKSGAKKGSKKAVVKKAAAKKAAKKTSKDAKKISKKGARG